MKKHMFLVLALSLPMISFAQRTNDPRTTPSPRQVLEEETQATMMAARKAVTLNLEKMTARELRETQDLLLRVIDLAEGRVPTGPVVVAPPQMACAQVQTETFQETFIKVKNFAYSTSGINLSSSEATAYATEWTNKYPCVLADKYIQDFKRLKTFAYATAGLNYTSSEAISYATTMISRLCVQVDVEGIFKTHFNFAYATSGLNMSASEARSYAKVRVEQEGFVCRNL